MCTHKQIALLHTNMFVDTSRPQRDLSPPPTVRCASLPDYYPGSPGRGRGTLLPTQPIKPFVLNRHQKVTTPCPHLPER